MGAELVEDGSGEVEFEEPCSRCWARFKYRSKTRRTRPSWRVGTRCCSIERSADSAAPRTRSLTVFGAVEVCVGDGSAGFCDGRAAVEVRGRSLNHSAIVRSELDLSRESTGWVRSGDEEGNCEGN